MLEALFPGRIDLGIGRAPGGDPRTALALMDGEYQGAEHMPQQVQDLIGFLDGSLPAGHPYAKVKAQPAGDTSPEIWLLGSSDYGGALARSSACASRSRISSARLEAKPWRAPTAINTSPRSASRNPGRSSACS